MSAASVRRAMGIGALLVCSVILAGWGANGALASAPGPGLGAYDAVAGAADHPVAPATPDAASAERVGESDPASTDGAASQGAAPFSASKDAREGAGAAAGGDLSAANAGGGVGASAEGEAAADEAMGSAETPAAKVDVGPWFARFDAGAVDRARVAAKEALAESAAVGARLAASLLAAVVAMCVAAGAACFIRARSFGPLPILCGARPKAASAMPTKKSVVTRRKEA